MSKRLVISVLLIGVLFIVAVGAASAQGNRPNNPGGPNADPPRTGDCQADCPNAQQQTQSETQQQAGQQYQNQNQVQDPNGVQTQQTYGNANRAQVRDPQAYAQNLLPLTDEVIEAMTLGIQDEYNAALIYQAFIDAYGEVRPFAAILRAELRHIQAWERAFTVYGLEVPAMPDSVDIDIPATVAEACQLAYDAEVANMGLYDEMLETVEDYPNLVRIVTALRNASLNSHMPALELCVGS